MISNKDFEVIVKEVSLKVGTLLISWGNVEWLPSRNSVNKKRLTWRQFASFMEALGATAKNKRD